MKVYCCDTALLILSGIAVCCHGKAALDHSLTRRSSSCARTMACLDPVFMLVDVVEKDFIAGLVPLTYGPVLDRACSQKRDVQRCLRRRRCYSDEHKYTGQAVLDLMGFICGEGKAKLLKLRGCLSRDDLEESTQMCSEVFRVEMDLTQTQLYSGLANQNSICTTFSSLFKCVERSARRSCGAGVEDLISDIYGYIHKNTAELSGCRVVFS